MKRFRVITASIAMAVMAAVPMWGGAGTAHADQAKAPEATEVSEATSSGAGVQNVLTCRTETPDGREGWAHCTNNTQQVVGFRVVVVCGMAPDAYGDWVTLSPGQSGSSGKRCGHLSTGVGSVSWEEG